MYTDPKQWSKIRTCILSGERSIRQTTRETGINRKTVRKMLDYPFPQPYPQREHRFPKLGPHTRSIRRLVWENATLPPPARLSIKAIYERLREGGGFEGSYGSVKDYVRSLEADDDSVWELAYDLLTSLEKKRAIEFLHMLSRTDPPIISASHVKRFYREAGRTISSLAKPDQGAQRRQASFEWMRAVLQKDLTLSEIRRDTGDVLDVAPLLNRLYEGRLSDRNRSMVVLARHRGLSVATVCSLGVSKQSCRRYLEAFENGGHAALFAPQTRSTRKFDNDTVKQAVFALLHEPPSKYGINRTAWIMPDLSRVLGETGQPVGCEVIRKITRAAGYRWRKAKVVLTSHDPEYAEKLSAVQNILSNLREDEVFFSIDEFGPFAVKMKPGRMLDPPGEQRVVPQWQKSRGRLIMTAALELSANQVTHFYSAAKNTDEMLKMMDLLLEQYLDRRTIYLSWDAASWHISKKLRQRIDEHNATAVADGRPRVETAPLPAGAQFLNVIESVFSGMARAIIHNSNYGSIDDAKAAIDRYFAERNAQFCKRPRRAGKKIWGKERVPPAFSEANNCKDPRYR